jgi:hypothetical protein
VPTPGGRTRSAAAPPATGMGVGLPSVGIANIFGRNPPWLWLNAAVLVTEG